MSAWASSRAARRRDGARALRRRSAPGMLVDLVLAMVSAAPAWSNLASLVFARRVQGQPKIGFLQPLLLAMTVCVAALALLPASGTGAAARSCCSTGPRACCGAASTPFAPCCGARTIRAGCAPGSPAGSPSTPRSRSRRRGLVLGWLLERGEPWFRVWILAAALLRPRREHRVPALPGATRGRRCSPPSARAWSRVRASAWPACGSCSARDAAFRRYMYAMSLFGAGNLTLTPMLVVCFDEVLHLPSFWQIAVTTAVPVLVIPFAIQPWARYLDRHHVIAFRSVHGWVTGRRGGPARWRRSCCACRCCCGPARC